MPGPRLLASLLSRVPPVWRRALRGWIGRPTVLDDELPAGCRPGERCEWRDLPGLPPVGRELTILSYNVKRGERMLQVISSLRLAVAEHRPELVLLQEAPLELVHHADLEEVMGGRALFFAPFHQVACPDRRYPYPRYGQLTASSCRIAHRAVVELPTVNPATLGPAHLMKRIALYTELPTAAGGRVGVVNVHNEPFTRRRLRLLQHSALLTVVDERDPEIAVCCGDFNPSLGQRGEPGLKLLEAAGFENAFARRWRTLDTCLARGHRAFTAAVSLPLPGSDHRPIVVRIYLGEVVGERT